MSVRKSRSNSGPRARSSAASCSAVNMPGISGLEFCRQLKDDPETRDIPIVVLTGSDGGTTSAAKEAGNMVDLDSNPTKLIEIVEIGKQLLITRGSLTTFSIANDVAKYFAILPALFAPVYPGLDRLNLMDLQSPQSAIVSAISSADGHRSRR